MKENHLKKIGLKLYHKTLRKISSPKFFSKTVHIMSTTSAVVTRKFCPSQQWECRAEGMGIGKFNPKPLPPPPPCAPPHFL